MTDGRWILDGLLGTAMRRMPGMSSVGLERRADLASAAMASTRDPGDNVRTQHASRATDPVDRPFDPKLRATTEMILQMSVDDRLRQLEAESKLFSSIRPLDG